MRDRVEIKGVEYKLRGGEEEREKMDVIDWELGSGERTLGSKGASLRRLHQIERVLSSDDHTMSNEERICHLIRFRAPVIDYLRGVSNGHFGLDKSKTCDRVMQQ